MFFNRKKQHFKNENPNDVINELIKLGKLAKGKEDFKKLLLQEFPYVRYYTNVYHYTFLNYDINLYKYEIDFGNITYGFEEENDIHIFVYIKVDDIVIYHNAKENCNSGLFNGIKNGWNHNAPEKLLEQISNDVNIFRNAIYNIENNRSKKWTKEQDRLNEIFK